MPRSDDDACQNLQQEIESAIEAKNKPQPPPRRKRLVRRSQKAEKASHKSSAAGSMSDSEDDDPVSAALNDDLDKVSGLLGTLQMRQSLAKQEGNEDRDTRREFYEDAAELVDDMTEVEVVEALEVVVLEMGLPQSIMSRDIKEKRLLVKQAALSGRFLPEEVLLTPNPP